MSPWCAELYDSRRTTVASTNGSPPPARAAPSPSRPASISTAPEASSGTAEMPARKEVFIPRANSALSTGVQRRPASSMSARSLWCPSTTSTGSSPASRAVPTARRSTLVPPSGSKSLLRPIRLEVPAASTTPARRPERSSVMDASPLGAQVRRLAPRVHGEHLGDDADRDLLRAVGREVEAHRRKQPLRFGRAELPQDLVLPRSGTEQPEVGERLRQQGAQPVPVVLQRVRLDDGEVAPAESEAVQTVLRAAQEQARRGREPLRGEEGAPGIDHRHFEARLGGEGGERSPVVAGPELDQAR